MSRLVVGVGVGVDGRLGSIQRKLPDSKDLGWKTCSPRLAAALYYSDKIFGLAGFTTPHDQTIATIISVGVDCLAT